MALPHQRKPIDYLSDFVFFGGPSLAPVSKQLNGLAAFGSLAQLAVAENWGPNFKILFNYMDKTFARVCQLDRQNGRIHLVYSSDMQYACFNTGLSTGKWAPIYCLLTRAPGYDATNAASREYAFSKFIVERDLKNQGRFAKLPPPPSYYDNPYECFYDYRVPIHENIDHIMSGEHKKRIIEAFPQFKAFSESIQESLIRDSIEMAKLRCASNIRTVVPQYYRQKIQLLMPLTIEDSVRVVLVLEKKQNVTGDPVDHSRPEEWFYDASTILSRDMAYNNARLIFRIESEWLNTDDSKPEDDESDSKDEDDSDPGPNLRYCKFCNKSDAHPRNQCPDFRRDFKERDSESKDSDDSNEDEGDEGDEGDDEGVSPAPRPFARAGPNLLRFCKFCNKSDAHPRNQCPEYRR